MPHPEYYLGEGPGSEPYDHERGTKELWRVYSDDIDAPPGSDAWMAIHAPKKGTPVGDALDATASAVGDVVNITSGR